MTKPESPMNHEPIAEPPATFVIRASCFLRHSSLVIRHWAVWVALSALAALPGCHHAEEEKEEWPPVPVRTAVVEKRTLRPSFVVIGTVMADPQRQATLSAAAPGLVDKL